MEVKETTSGTGPPHSPPSYSTLPTPVPEEWVGLRSALSLGPPSPSSILSLCLPHLFPSFIILGLVSIPCLLFLPSFVIASNARPPSAPPILSWQNGLGAVVAPRTHSNTVSLQAVPSHTCSREMKRATSALSRCVLHKATVAPCY